MSDVRDAIAAEGGKVLSLVFDGAYFLAKDHEDLLRVYRSTSKRIFAKTGVKVALKAADGVLIETF